LATAQIPIRRPTFPFDAEQIPRHWANGNALMTHVGNAIQLTFPEGERFFIRAVQDVLRRIDDPELVAEARAFMGQESIHGREHERYFDVMRAHGYEIDRFLRRLQRFIGWLDELPASLRIAITAGVEHYTATMGWMALRDPVLRRFDPTMQALMVWHAAEEVEHKAVAFDVMQAAGIGYVTRIVGFLIGTASLFFWGALGARMLLRQDGLSRDDVRRLARQMRATRVEQDAGVERELRRRVLAYFRRRFHPSDEDDLARARRRFGELEVPEDVSRALLLQGAA
jgi:predicted metal-dependent hydrolase